MGPAKQAIADLRAIPGELSFEARIGPEPKRIWFRTETAVTPPADAALAACLLPAMRAGGTLTMSDPVSPRVLRGQREFGAIQQAWSRRWEYGEPPLREVEVTAPVREPARRAPSGRVAAFFSGGVDSFATILDSPDLTDLIFVRGVDLLPAHAGHAAVVDEAEARIRAAASELGLELHVVATNVRELSDVLVPWEAYCACPLYAVALCFEPLFDRVLIASATDYANQTGIGSSRFVDQLWSSETVEIVADGGRRSRAQRIARIAADPSAQATLRVCWENRDGAYNCGRCAKCLMTMVVLEALGVRSEFERFPAELDLGALSAVKLQRPLSLVLWEDVLTSVLEAGRADLEQPVLAVLEGGRGRLDRGLPGAGRLRPLPPPADAPDQEIAGLRLAPGELSFEARIGPEPKRIWFRTETAVTPPADAALAACLLPAMRAGGTLTMSDPVSPRVLRGQREFGAAHAAWSQTWSLPGGPLHEVEVSAPTREPARREPTGRVAAFFSGGVDSFAAVLDTPELTDLIFVRGVDLLPAHAGHMAVAEEVERRVREAAAGLGLQLHVVETNVRELSDGLVPWEAYFSGPLIAVAHFFEPLFDRVLIAGETDFELQEHLGYGSIWTAEQLWSSETLEIVSWGGRMSREQRVRLTAQSPVAQKMLRVCWRNPEGIYNCGECSKCLITMLGLEACGARERVRTFPALDVAKLDGIAMQQTIQLILWEDLLTSLRVAGRRDLVRAVAGYVERGRRDLGMPGFRGRAAATDSGQAPAGPPPGAAPTLFAEPATAAALDGAPSAAVLVGSYDGSGNFGDIAQLEGALAALAPLQRELTPFSLVELGAAERHRDPTIAPRGADRVLFFDPTAAGAPGLVPVSPPPGLGLGVCFLYGGGYLNAHWGERKLAMLTAAEALLAGARGGLCRVASGLQVEAEWLQGLAPGRRDQLRRFEVLGSRDPASTVALAELGGGSVLAETGDDALGAFGHLRPGPPPAADGPLRLNLHFADHDWVSDDGDRILAFVADLLAALGARHGGPLRVQPLLAYVDGVTDERAGLERLRTRCEDARVELLEPRLLRTAELDGLAAELREASLTLSCSYHASLVSLLLGVPAVLLADVPYYEQKSAGLSAGFGLPPELAASSREDAAAVAARLAAAALEPAAAARLRTEILLGAERMRTRRAAGEAAILGRIGGAGLDRVAVSGAELGILFGSRSWRLTEPLRRAGAKLRERRRRS